MRLYSIYNNINYIQFIRLTGLYTYIKGTLQHHCHVIFFTRKHTCCHHHRIAYFSSRTCLFSHEHLADHIICQFLHLLGTAIEKNVISRFFLLWITIPSYTHVSHITTPLILLFLNCPFALPPARTCAFSTRSFVFKFLARLAASLGVFAIPKGGVGMPASLNKVYAICSCTSKFRTSCLTIGALCANNCKEQSISYVHNKGYI